MGDEIGSNVIDFPTPEKHFALPGQAYAYLAKLTGASVDQLKVDARGGNINPKLNASPADAGILVIRLAQEISDLGIQSLPFQYNNVAGGDCPFARLEMFVSSVKAQRASAALTAELDRRNALAKATKAPGVA